MRGIEQVRWAYDLLRGLVDRLGLTRWRRWLAAGGHGRTLEVGCEDLVQPAWTLLAGGRHPNRDAEAAVEAAAGRSRPQAGGRAA